MPVASYQGTEGIFEPEDHFSAACLQHYQQQGWVLLKGFYDLTSDLLPIHIDVNQLIAAKVTELALDLPIEVMGPINHDAFLAICDRERSKAGEIYRATRHLSSTHKLLVKENNLKLAQLLMGTCHVNVLPYVPLRIDVKGEEKYLFDWHQDFPYTQGSEDGIVIWAPLFDVLNNEGGIKFIPGSHKNGIEPVIIADKQNSNENGAHTVRLPAAERFDAQQAFTLDVRAGDVLVFSTLLLHKSLPLQKQQIRWTTQLRYANFMHPAAVQKGWPGGMIEGCWFEDIYPEYVVQDNKETA